MVKMHGTCASPGESAVQARESEYLVRLLPRLKRFLEEQQKKQPMHLHDLIEVEVYGAYLSAARSYDRNRQHRHSLNAHFVQLAEQRVKNALRKNQTLKRGGGVVELRQSRIENTDECSDWESRLPPSDDGSSILLRTLISLCVGRLPKNEKSILRLRAEGYTPTEIAASLGVSVSTAKRQLKKAQASFKNACQYYEGIMKRVTTH